MHQHMYPPTSWSLLSNWLDILKQYISTRFHSWVWYWLPRHQCRLMSSCTANLLPFSNPPAWINDRRNSIIAWAVKNLRGPAPRALFVWWTQHTRLPTTLACRQSQSSLAQFSENASATCRQFLSRVSYHKSIQDYTRLCSTESTPC